jgi:hypothetical protein
MSLLQSIPASMGRLEVSEDKKDYIKDRGDVVSPKKLILYCLNKWFLILVRLAGKFMCCQVGCRGILQTRYRLVSLAYVSSAYLGTDGSHHNKNTKWCQC